MIGSIPTQFIITIFLYGILYCSVHTAVFAKCGSFREGFRLIGKSGAMRREAVNIALFTGAVYSVINMTFFAPNLIGPELFAQRLAATGFPMAPAAVLALIFAFVRPCGNGGPGHGGQDEEQNGINKKRKRPIIRYAAGSGGVVLFVFLYALFSRNGFPIFILLDPVAFFIVLIGFGLGQLLWLLPRRKREKERRKIYRPGFISTIMFFYSLYTAAALFLLVNGSLHNATEIGNWTGVFLLSTLYYMVLFIVLRGSRVRRFCKTRLWKEWRSLPWQTVLMPIAVVVVTAGPYIFFAWFLR